MAGRTGSRVVASRVFPRGVYTAAADRPSGTAECQENLQHSLPGSGRDPTNDCGRPPTSGGGNRLPGRASHLGPEPAPPSAYPLRSAWRRNQPRQLTVDPLPKISKIVLPSRQGAERLFPQGVPDSFAKGLPERQAPVPRRTGPVGPTGGLRDRKSTRLNSSHLGISYAVFC